MTTVLVLNADYTLLEVVSWQKAVSMLFADKVRLVEQYADRFLRSTSVTLPFPAVVVRTKYVGRRRRVRFSRRNILARDGFTCQYCGAVPRRPQGTPNLEMLTIDHVVPHAQSQDGWVTLPWDGERVRVTSWRNVLTACAPCNGQKAARTPKQAGFTMRKHPQAPTPMQYVWMSLFRYDIPSEWEDYLPEGSPWREYWRGELG
jgi:5-methylcytosine-specific restriction endonuclease McrA